MTKGQYLLAIDPIPSAIPQTDPRYFPAYFVGSTAPNNVEDRVQDVDNPEPCVQEISKFLLQHPSEREILITVHGYNTSLGEFATPTSNPSGIKGWYQTIREHVANQYASKPKGLVFLGYRWSSEVIKGVENDTLAKKIQFAQESLPLLLKLLILGGIVGVILSLISFFTIFTTSLISGIFAVLLLSLSLITASLIFTLIALRISGYFRDSYRAVNYGVPDLVELIRQLDKAIFEATPGTTEAEKRQYWQNASDQERIKLSFIGHSMGGYVVTNTVRILSDVFDLNSIGQFNTPQNNVSSWIGNVFSLGRLVLVSPDIPAETIIAGRANFLSSSLRRFEEAYLFSNEGDMALRLASTAANYFSFPAKTRAAGYRLGNVVVREDCGDPGVQIASEELLKKAAGKPTEGCGIVNLDPQGHLVGVRPRSDRGFETTKVLGYAQLEEGEAGLEISSFLNYLFITPDKPLAKRQSELLRSSDRKPIAELFTYFDCTDYTEPVSSKRKRVGILTHALGKTSLNFWDYVRLTLAYGTGKLDTHGGYFSNGDPTDPGKVNKRAKPEAKFTKHLIYGLACLGFEGLLEPLIVIDLQAPPDADPIHYRRAALKVFSEQCQERGVQVLLAVERYNRDILKLRTPTDRQGY